MKLLLWAIFLFALTFMSAAQAQDTLSCDKGYIVNVNGENRCIDTTELYYFPYYYRNVSDYPEWNYTIIMKILNESQWNDESLSENKIRVLFFDNICFDTLFLFSFSNLDKDTIHLVKYKMLTYFSPEKRPSVSKFLKKDHPYFNRMQGGDTIYTFTYIDSLVSMTDKIRWDNLIQDWYTENYGKIDTVTYTTAEYQIPRKSYDKFLKNIVNLKDYNFSTELIIDIILIEYVINSKYQLNWITQDEHRDNFFRKNRDNLLKWLNKYM